MDTTGKNQLIKDCGRQTRLFQLHEENYPALVQFLIKSGGMTGMSTLLMQTVTGPRREGGWEVTFTVRKVFL